MNSWFEIVRNTPHLKNKFINVMVNGKGAELEVTQPLSCSLALHLFGALRAQELAVTDGIWLYTERKLAESTPAGDANDVDVCIWPPLAGFDESKWPSANWYPSFPAAISDIASAASASGAGLSAADVGAMMSAVENEATRARREELKLVEQVVCAADCKPLARAAAAAAAPSSSVAAPPASLVDRWMSRRVNAVAEPFDAKRLVDWCFFSHPSADRSVRAFNTCAQRRVFLACELKRVATGHDRNGVPFLVNQCVAQLLHDFARTMSAAPCERHPVMFGIASDFRTFHVLRFSMAKHVVAVQYSAAVELAPRAVVDELLRDDSVSWCDAFARVGATGALTFATIIERIVRCAGANAMPTPATNIVSILGQRLPVPYTPGADLPIDDEQAKVRGASFELDNHDIIFRDFIGSSSRSAVFVVDVERRDTPGDPGVSFVMKFAHTQDPSAFHFKNDVSMLLAESGRQDIAQIAGWYNDGLVHFLLLSTAGTPLWRVCHCAPDRRLLLLKSLAVTVGGVLQRWHAARKIYSDLHGGNVLVRDDMSVFLCDLETLAEIVVVDGVATVRDVGSPVPLSVHRSQAHDVCELVKLITACWR